MKTHFALTTISFFLTISLPSCQQSSKSGFASELPIIDLEKEYPVKRIDIHEIADVEYIPLETTDESLLQTPNSWAVSEIRLLYLMFYNIPFSYLMVKENIYGQLTASGKAPRNTTRLYM